MLRQAQAADDEEDRRYGKDKRGDELPQELAQGRLEKIREAMAALEAEAQAAAEQAEAEGRKHPGVPSVTSPIPSRASSPHLEGTSQYKSRVVDSAHQVMVRLRISNRRGDDGGDHRQTSVQSPGKFRRCWLLLGKGSRRGWASVRRAGADPTAVCHPRPEVAYPAICLPGTGCTEVTDQAGSAAPLRMQRAGIGQIKQGRGFRQFLATANGR